jgi:hypothetical protein
MSVRDADKSQPYVPLAGLASDGWSKEDQATATCYCGAVQLAFVRRHSLTCLDPTSPQSSPPHHLNSPLPMHTYTA